MKRQYEKISKKHKKPKVRKMTDNQIQLECRHTVEKALYRFTRNSMLKTIASFIDKDYYANIYPFVVTEIMRMGTAACGIHMALQAVIEAMKDVCNEAATIILSKAPEMVKMYKTPVSITLLCETLDMPTVTRDELIANEDLNETTPLQIRHILTNDRNRDWIKQYRDAKMSKINVFTVRLGPGNTKGSATTGRYVVSVLMPHTAPTYRLNPMHEPFNNSFEELAQKYRLAVIGLTAHENLAKASTKEKLTVYEHAAILARGLQHKELDKMRHLVSDQSAHIAMITRQNHDLQTILNSPTMKDVKALQDMIDELSVSLRQSRRKNLSLFTRLQDVQALCPKEVLSTLDALENASQDLQRSISSTSSTTTTTTTNTHNHKKILSLPNNTLPLPSSKIVKSLPVATAAGLPIKRLKTSTGYVKRQTCSSSSTHNSSEDDDSNAYRDDEEDDSHYLDDDDDDDDSGESC